jgi:molecular chaperone Hsp33
LGGENNQRLDKLSDVLEHYMMQSQQIRTTLVLAANDRVAAGLLLQFLPQSGNQPLAETQPTSGEEVEPGIDEDYRRLATLASSLRREELLTLDGQTLLHRLFWQERPRLHAPVAGEKTPHFYCTCSRERVHNVILGLGFEEAQSVVIERGGIEVGCEFCGTQYRFAPLDVTQMFDRYPRPVKT